ncbi:GNAT family N-acetyltransferase [Nocardioides sp.]|uniref:GNAT family N-acetyltransferase n=1 Tax=Nocardioides sp. TaxID=35761 RepID=UPI002634D1EB|nr:GNAT family N-acetyltransferase [Nocardioides sp.]MDI6911089.1 GNAT family N-acetyltransferase [Nocardioides sp.]
MRATGTSSGTSFNTAAQASRAASAAAARAGVTVTGLESIADLRDASALLEAVWGRTPEGVPLPREMMRSLVHAGGLVSAAYGTDRLLGVAVLGRSVGAACYSYLAATLPSSADRGTGFALKQHQRAWALGEGLTTMRWTFDPLVSRNARFNLSKLGARACIYEPAFYGRMSDALNGDDVADRLVAEWQLDSARAVSASEGTAVPAEAPAEADLTAVECGPDGGPAWQLSTREAWCRVPTDVVSLRRTDPGLASAWREAVGAWLRPAFADGFVATSAGRTGWYHLEKEH